MQNSLSTVDHFFAPFGLGLVALVLEMNSLFSSPSMKIKAMSWAWQQANNNSFSENMIVTFPTTSLDCTKSRFQLFQDSHL
jgi:hypothetical protein